MNWDVTFANPEFFLLLLLIPAMIFWYWRQQKKDTTSLQFSALHHLDNAPKSLRQRLHHLPFILRLLSVALISVALARPQSSSSRQEVTTEGIDIVMALDISGSMKAQDFKPNRLEAAKKVAENFIQNRPNDRVGLVVFAGEAFTQCPLTTDHSVVLNLFEDIEHGMIEDGTAIGMGLATSVKRLKESKAKSKVVILLTDGVNQGGSIPPLTAAEIAKTFGIRTYTIGVGSKGQAPYPVTNIFGQTEYRDMDVKIDEELLKEIAQMTNGKYFRATDNESLKNVYNEIDQLEKSKIDVMEYRKKKEEFLPLALIALGLFLLEIVFRNTVFRSIP